MKKSFLINSLLVASALVAMSCYYISNHTVTFMYVNPYTETAGMKNISKTVLDMEKVLDGARKLASDNGYKFDYVYTNAYGSGFLKYNPIPNDLDYDVFIDLGTFDYTDAKTKDDVANEIMEKIEAFQYYFNAYINISDDSKFNTLRSPFDMKNALKSRHQKYSDEIAASLDDAITNKRYVNHLTKVAKDDGTVIYYMPYVMDPGQMLLKDFDLMMMYSDEVSYYDYMLKYERIVSLSLSFCATINHNGKTTYIEIFPELFSTGPLMLSYRLYAPNVFFRNSAIRYLSDQYSLTDDETYLKRLLYCFADHLEVVYPDDAFEYNPIKIFKRTLQLTDMVAPVLGKEEAQEIYDFIQENLQNRDIQLLNEYINLCDIIGRIFKSPKLYVSFVNSRKMHTLIKTLSEVLKELKSRGNIPPEYIKVLEDYVKNDVIALLKMESIRERSETQKTVVDRDFRKNIMPVISKAVLTVVTDKEKMQHIIDRLKNIYFDSGFRFINIYVAGPDTFELEKNEFTDSIKDFKDFAAKNDLAEDMKFKILPKNQIPKEHLKYEIWVRYNTTKEQDEYYAKVKKALLDHKSKFKINKKTYFVK